MRKVVGALQQPSANTQRDKEKRARRKQNDVVTCGQVQVLGYNRTAQHQKKSDACAVDPCAAKKEFIDADLRFYRVSLGNKLRAQQLEGKGDRRQQHQHGVNRAGMSEPRRAQPVRDREVVDEIHQPDQAGTDQHDHAAAQHPRADGGCIWLLNAFDSAFQGLRRRSDEPLNGHKVGIDRRADSEKIQLEHWTNGGPVTASKVVKGLLLQSDRKTDGITDRHILQTVMNRLLNRT